MSVYTVSIMILLLAYLFIGILIELFLFPCSCWVIKDDNKQSKIHIILWPLFVILVIWNTIIDLIVEYAEKNKELVANNEVGTIHWKGCNTCTFLKPFRKCVAPTQAITRDGCYMICHTYVSKIKGDK